MKVILKFCTLILLANFFTSCTEHNDGNMGVEESKIRVVDEIISVERTQLDQSTFLDILSKKEAEDQLIFVRTKARFIEFQFLDYTTDSPEHAHPIFKDKHDVTTVLEQLLKLPENYGISISTFNQKLYLDLHKEFVTFSRSEDNQIIEQVETFSYPTLRSNGGDDSGTDFGGGSGGSERKYCRIDGGGSIECTGGDCVGRLVFNQFCVFCVGGSNGGTPPACDPV
ncbi:MAG: hypothetical protein AAGA77_25955 [Bacteroidota bacterium]